MKQILFIFLLALSLNIATSHGKTALAEGSGTHDHKAETNEHNSHDEHDGHDGHDEDTVKIIPEHAEKAGIRLSSAKPEIIAQDTVLNGQITLNQDKTANVRARFSGVVRAVPVNLGQEVKKGDVLARIESNESLRSYTLTAPISGVILEKNTNIGDVADNEILFVIADLSTVWAKFHIFSKESSSIRIGQNVRVHTIDHGKEAISVIKLFLPTADALSQTHIAIAELDNSKGIWRPGLTIDGHVEISREKVSIAVPKTALQTMENQDVLFVETDGKYEMRPVKIGRSDGTMVEIIDGLNAGERYVSEGSFVIKADIMKSGAAHEH